MAGTSTYPTTADALTKTAVDNPDVVDAVVTVQAVHRRDKLVQTLTPAPAGAVAIDVSLGLEVIIQMPAGNISLLAPIGGPQAGDVLTLKTIQDGVGSRTISAVAANIKRIGGALALSAGAGAVDTVSFRFDGVNWNQMAAPGLALA
jgi:hypothetical protein